MILQKQDIKDLLKKYAISEREGLILLGGVVNLTYSELFFKTNFDLSTSDFQLFESYLKRRLQKEPISKILERKEFYGLLFKTTKDTLDPRPETELIIDLFQKYYPNKSQNLHILDLGSGTGCIGLSLLSLYKNASCDFVDISEKALDIAKYNADNLGLAGRAGFKISDWFSNVHEIYDAIVSNPPYISMDYALDEEVLFDPKTALFAENEGMAAYNVIIPKASEFLKNTGMMFLEIGFDQGDKIKSIKTNLKLLSIEKDLSSNDRVAIYRKLDKTVTL